MENLLSFTNREDWRFWLKENYDKENYVWLTLYKKKFRKKGMTLQDAVEEAICFGWIDGKLKRLDTERFILRFSPRKAKSVWSKINKERAEMLMKSGKMTDAGLVKIQEAKKNGLWESAYTNKTKEDVPLDLKEALMKEKKAWDNFQRFANSYRNMYIGWVNGAKTVETRIKRIKKVVEQSLLNKKFVFI
jgi:uncharacterized protein YdeI (YjbR/CyaY-like superfamily)